MFFKEVHKDKLPASTVEADSLKFYSVPISKSLDWVTARPILTDAALLHFTPILGTSFLSELETAYNAYPGTALSAIGDAFIRKLQRSLAWFMVFEAQTDLLVNVSGMGPSEAQNANGTFNSPRLWVHKETKRSAWVKANEFLDLALAYADDNIDDTFFITWKSSSHYDRTKDLFINSAQELQTLIPGRSLRVVYTMLRPHIIEAELRYLKPVLGPEFFADLKDKIKANNLSTDEQTALDYIRRSLVKWIIKLAVPALNMSFTDQGLLEPNFSQGLQNDDQGDKALPFHSERVRSLFISLDEAGRFFLYDLKNYLDENSGLFSVYEASDANESDSPARDIFYAGPDDDNGVVGMF